MRLSIIIPAYNNGPELSECLRSLVPALADDVEIIVVDDGSTDDVAAAIDGAVAGDAASVRVATLPKNVGPAAARNEGAALAEGEILLFIDADVVASPEAVDRVRVLFEQDAGIDAVFGSYDDKPRAPALVSQFRNLLHHYTHQTGNSEAFTFWAGFGAVRREAFRDVHGFDSDARWFSIEDIELGYRLRAAGRRIVMDKSLQVTHLKRWTLASVIRTDILYRALPWTRLILQKGSPPSDLNVQHAQKVSLLLVAIAILAACAIPILPRFVLPALAALAGVLYLNRRFYGFLYRARGGRFAVVSFFLHLVYFVCSGIGLTLGWMAHGFDRVFGAGSRSRRPAPGS